MGGGGSWNPVNIVSDAVSSVGDALASIDPGPAIGKAGAELDTFVNREIPGGWTLPAAIAAMYLTGYVDPSILGTEAGATAAGEAAYANAIEAGYSAAEATEMANAAAEAYSLGEGAAMSGSELTSAFANAPTMGEVGAGLSEIPVELTPEMIPPDIPTGPEISLEQGQAIDYTTPLDSLAPTPAPTPTTALPYTEAYDAINLAKQGIGADQIANILTTSNSSLAPFIAQDIATMASNGLSEAAINQALQYGYSASELSPLGLESMLPGADTSLIPQELKDALRTANTARNFYNLLSGVGGTQVPKTGGLNLMPYSTPTIGTTGTASSMLPNLTAGVVKGQPINLDMPMFAEPMAPINAAEGGYIQHYASAGEVDSYTDTNYQDTVTGLAKLKPNLLKGKSDFSLQKYWNPPTDHYAEGGEVEHNPEFFSEGGLQNRYVKGDGDGTSDSVPAMLANGEFVIPADVVSDLGNGSNDSGAQLLDEFLSVIRKHKRQADAKDLPPDSKGPLGYLLEAKRKTKVT
jgi:hypothetical protein